MIHATRLIAIVRSYFHFILTSVLHRLNFFHAAMKKLSRYKDVWCVPRIEMRSCFIFQNYSGDKTTDTQADRQRDKLTDK